MLRVIKKINNNCALCEDRNGRRIVAFGKGIGFRQPPYVLQDSSQIRTYYEFKDEYQGLIDAISPEVLETTNEIVTYARAHIPAISNENLVFTLADHISFSIRRQNGGINLQMPVINDVICLYTEEIRVGEWALQLIRERLGVVLPDSEIICIAFHLINAESGRKSADQTVEKRIVRDVIFIIESDIGIHVDTNSYNYFRFLTHLYYLLQREISNRVTNEYSTIYRNLIGNFPEIYSCIKDIEMYFYEQLDRTMNDDEKVYLMLHVIRLCNREVSL